ncbi:hypothetical protein T492DRAFT_70968 [Pavlovales sp. CCMP2436]|nr:hypothetical protein T492DRAFT_70968 [Pavlovales sp. CCMP2436]
MVQGVEVEGTPRPRLAATGSRVDSLPSHPMSPTQGSTVPSSLAPTPERAMAARAAAACHGGASRTPTPASPVAPSNLRPPGELSQPAALLPRSARVRAATFFPSPAGAGGPRLGGEALFSGRLAENAPSGSPHTPPLRDGAFGAAATCAPAVAQAAAGAPAAGVLGGTVGAGAGGASGACGVGRASAGGGYGEPLSLLLGDSELIEVPIELLGAERGAEHLRSAPGAALAVDPPPGQLAVDEALLWAQQPPPSAPLSPGALSHGPMSLSLADLLEPDPLSPPARPRPPSTPTRPQLPVCASGAPALAAAASAAPAAASTAAPAAAALLAVLPAAAPAAQPAEQPVEADAPAAAPARQAHAQQQPPPLPTPLPAEGGGGWAGGSEAEGRQACSEEAEPLPALGTGYARSPCASLLATGEARAEGLELRVGSAQLGQSSEAREAAYFEAQGEWVGTASGGLRPASYPHRYERGPAFPARAAAQHGSEGEGGRSMPGGLWEQQTPAGGHGATLPSLPSLLPLPSRPPLLPAHSPAIPSQPSAIRAAPGAAMAVTAARSSEAAAVAAAIAVTAVTATAARAVTAAMTAAATAAVVAAAAAAAAAAAGSRPLADVVDLCSSEEEGEAGGAGGVAAGGAGGIGVGAGEEELEPEPPRESQQQQQQQAQQPQAGQQPQQQQQQPSPQPQPQLQLRAVLSPVPLLRTLPDTLVPPSPTAQSPIAPSPVAASPVAASPVAATPVRKPKHAYTCPPPPASVPSPGGLPLAYGREISELARRALREQADRSPDDGMLLYGQGGQGGQGARGWLPARRGGESEGGREGAPRALAIATPPASLVNAAPSLGALPRAQINESVLPADNHNHDHANEQPPGPAPSISKAELAGVPLSALPSSAGLFPSGRNPPGLFAPRPQRTTQRAEQEHRAAQAWVVSGHEASPPDVPPPGASPPPGLRSPHRTAGWRPPLPPAQHSALRHNDTAYNECNRRGGGASPAGREAGGVAGGGSPQGGGGSPSLRAGSSQRVQSGRERREDGPSAAAATKAVAFALPLLPGSQADSAPRDAVSLDELLPLSQGGERSVLLESLSASVPPDSLPEWSERWQACVLPPSPPQQPPSPHSPFASPLAPLSPAHLCAATPGCGSLSGGPLPAAAGRREGGGEGGGEVGVRGGGGGREEGGEVEGEGWGSCGAPSLPAELPRALSESPGGQPSLPAPLPPALLSPAQPRGDEGGERGAVAANSTPQHSTLPPLPHTTGDVAISMAEGAAEAQHAAEQPQQQPQQPPQPQQEEEAGLSPWTPENPQLFLQPPQQPQPQPPPPQHAPTEQRVLTLLNQLPAPPPLPATVAVAATREMPGGAGAQARGKGSGGAGAERGTERGEGAWRGESLSLPTSSSDEGEGEGEVIITAATIGEAELPLGAWGGGGEARGGGAGGEGVGGGGGWEVRAETEVMAQWGEDGGEEEGEETLSQAAPLRMLCPASALPSQQTPAHTQSAAVGRDRCNQHKIQKYKNETKYKKYKTTTKKGDEDEDDDEELNISNNSGHDNNNMYLI